MALSNPDNKLLISQKKKGYRYSIDPFLLVSFAQFSPGSKVVDLGTGSGVLPLLLSRNTQIQKMVGLEIQPSLAKQARHNVKANTLEDRINIIEADVRALPDAFKGGEYDAVVTNPPYREIHSGRVANNLERSMARHEIRGELRDFLTASQFLLKAGGRFFIVYLADRLAHLLKGMQEARIEPKRLRMVHSRYGDKACLVLVEGRKNSRPGITVEPPLYIYREKENNYSEEVLSIYRENNIEDVTFEK